MKYEIEREGEREKGRKEEKFKRDLVYLYVIKTNGGTQGTTLGDK